jgi:hypothetical protein
MKKNAMLKVAAVVLVAVLLTTCAISSTFAKYVTEDVTKSSVEARVAKWGVEVNTTALADLDELFVKEYNSDGNDADGAKEVISLSDAVVAPGTYKKIVIDSVATGKPEVSGKITTTADLKLANWTVASDVEYCPLVFYVNNTPISNVTSMADLEIAVENAIKQAGSKEFDANEDLEHEKYTITIEWEWLFDGANDVNDTYLADKTTNVPTVSLDLTVGVEQTGAAVVKS